MCNLNIKINKRLIQVLTKIFSSIVSYDIASRMTIPFNLDIN
jgi:hypothetical protein